VALSPFVLWNTNKPSIILNLGCLLRAANIPWDTMGFSIEIFPDKTEWTITLHSTAKNSPKEVLNEILYLRRHVDHQPYEGCEDYKKNKRFLESLPPYCLPSLPIGMRCPAMGTLRLIPHGLSTMPAFLSCHAYSSSKPENKISPLVKVLNRIPGIATVWSCQGHYERNLPFVKFLSPFSLVLQIKNVLSSNELYLNWIIKGKLFNHCPRTGPYILWELTPERKILFSSILLRKAQKDISILANLISSNLSQILKKTNGNVALHCSEINTFLADPEPASEEV